MMSKLIPINSKRRQVIKTAAKLLGWRPEDLYSTIQHDRKDKIQLFDTLPLEHKPLISVVVPCYNTPDKYLGPFIQSVISQTYDNWELVLVDASSDTSATKSIRQHAQRDNRVKYLKVKNLGISSNTNKGIKQAVGEYIGFMDHDDVLELNALYEVARVININPDAGLIYSDEGKLSEDGKKYLDPHFKPDWSPHLLTHVNYITHFTIAKRSIIKSVGYLDPKKDGAQDYDLVLRISDTGTEIVHIPKVLYHWRIADNSTASDISNKPYVLTAGVRALEDHYARKKIKANVSAITGMPGFYDVDYIPKKLPLVLVTPFANKDLVAAYVKVLWDRGVLDGHRIVVPHEVGIESSKVTIIESANERDYYLDALTDEDVVVVSEFVIPNRPDFFERLSGVLQDPLVRAVAPVVIETDGSIIDSGIIKAGPESLMIFKGFKLGDSTPFGNTSWPRDVNMLSGRFFATRGLELREYVKNSTKSGSYGESYASQRDSARYNVVWSRCTGTHVKSPMVAVNNDSEADFFNRNLYIHQDELHYYTNGQQIVDALGSLQQDGEGK